MSRDTPRSMARGWGNAPPDLKGTLGTLLRTTLFQLGSLRDAAVREIRSGSKQWAEKAPSLLRTRRTNVLASLGEIIYELARSGELDLDDFPELAQAIGELMAIDAEFGKTDEDDEDDEDDDAVSSSAWQGLMADEGTEHAPPVATSGIWRPNPNDYDEQGQRVGEAIDPPLDAPPVRPSRRTGAGHIAFVDDDPIEVEDLAEFMHEDDVPDRG